MSCAVPCDYSISSSSDSASGPRPGAAFGNVRVEPPSAFLMEGPSPQKPQRCPFRLGWGVWHREQVGPALLVCFSFSFIINLGGSLGHQKVPNDQLFERPRVKAFVKGFLFKSGPCKRGPSAVSFLLSVLPVPDPRAGMLGFIVHANISSLRASSWIQLWPHPFH